jgi:hypothetical protein
MITKMTILRKIFINVLYYLILFLGFFSIFLFLFFLVLRIGLQKELPFILTEYSFYVLILLCYVYIYLIKNQIKQQSFNFISKFLLYYVTRYYFIFHQFIKSIYYIHKIVKKFQRNTLKKITTLSKADNYFFLCIMNLLPRIILLFIFIVDVFFVKKIEVFYYFKHISVDISLIFFYVNNVSGGTYTYHRKKL